MPSSDRSEEHTSELQSLRHLVCRLLLEKKKEGLTGRYVADLQPLRRSSLTPQPPPPPAPAAAAATVSGVDPAQFLLWVVIFFLAGAGAPWVCLLSRRAVFSR